MAENRSTQQTWRGSRLLRLYTGNWCYAMAYAIILYALWSSSFNFLFPNRPICWQGPAHLFNYSHMPRFFSQMKKVGQAWGAESASPGLHKAHQTGPGRVWVSKPLASHHVHSVFHSKFFTACKFHEMTPKWARTSRLGSKRDSGWGFAVRRLRLTPPAPLAWNQNEGWVHTYGATVVCPLLWSSPISRVNISLLLSKLFAIGIG